MRELVRPPSGRCCEQRRRWGSAPRGSWPRRCPVPPATGRCSPSSPLSGGAIQQNGRTGCCVPRRGTTGDTMADEPRYVLVVAHTGRSQSLDAALTVVSLLTDGGVTPVVAASELRDLCAADGDLDIALLGDGLSVADLELVVVLGGDGTILRAAEIVRGTDVPVLGVNLGHVGFLAEAEREDL